MTDKTTSPDVAALAARILAGGNPLDNQQVRIAIQAAVMEHVHCSSPSQVVTVRVPDTVVENIGYVIAPYFENMLTLAASCVAQAENRDA